MDDSTNKESMWMKSRDEKGTQVALLSGHCCFIPKEGREVPGMFVDEAFRNGCVPCDVKTEDIPQAPKQTIDKGRDDLIVSAIKVMLERGDEMTAQGFPNLKTLAKETGFTVEREEMVKLFNAMVEEANAGNSAPDLSDQSPAAGMANDGEVKSTDAAQKEVF